jgi:hypothetical protein
MKVKNKMQTNQVIERIKETLTFLFIMLVGYVWLLIGSIAENPLIGQM